MVNEKDIVVGAKFRIVDEWTLGCNENNSGKMDKYLGTICTVGEIRGDVGRGLEFGIKEDQRDPYRPYGWIWNPYCINYIDTEIPDEISISDDEFNAII